MEKQHDIIMNLDDLFFQCQMLSGVAFLLWDSLAKPHQKPCGVFIIQSDGKIFICFSYSD